MKVRLTGFWILYETKIALKPKASEHLSQLNHPLPCIINLSDPRVSILPKVEEFSSWSIELSPLRFHQLYIRGIVMKRFTIHIRIDIVFSYNLISYTL